MAWFTRVPSNSNMGDDPSRGLQAQTAMALKAKLVDMPTLPARLMQQHLELCLTLRKHDADPACKAKNAGVRKVFLKKATGSLRG